MERGSVETHSADLTATIDAAPLGSRQLAIFALCFLAMLVDSFDAQLLPYLAPALSSDLAIPPAFLGGLISAGFIGTILGGLLGGMLADRAGRRSIALIGLVMFGLGTLGKGVAYDHSSLLALQVVTGIGLGGVYVNVLALSAEFAPRRNRAFIITLVTTANAVGGALSGFATAILEPSVGWRGVFLVAGSVTLAIFLLCLAGLPHSLTQLIQAGKRADYVRSTMRAIAPDQPAGTRWEVSIEPPSRLPLADVFRDGRTPLTLILCAAAFANFMTAYFVTSWTPTLMRQSGLSMQEAVAAATLIPVGSLVGSLTLGWLADRRWPPLVFGISAAISAAALLSIGFVTDVPLLRGTVLLVVGFGTGILSAFNGLIGLVFPPSIRGTALGFVLGVGRSGSIAGSLLGGVLLGFGWNVVQLYGVPAMASIFTLLCMVLISMLPGTRALIARQSQ